MCCLERRHPSLRWSVWGSSRQPYRPFQSQRSGFQPPETSSVRELSLLEQSGLQPTQLDATTVDRDDVWTGEGCTVSGGCDVLRVACIQLLNSNSHNRVLFYPIQFRYGSHVLFCFLSGCEGERRYRTLISLLGSVSLMRRVVNYHSSWDEKR
ncbi:hypothetical protein F511_40319 [Dorcoceras hygrometricum]|uniref:Uncharacterized protein n=1 Tax=Dorcoceras hygrometricum TaxID=472368 RepID=A0A2Z7CSK2_9LAMI|nr:hypothetical protein F511_40319 [Dorcoceras hygrometricum]